MVAIIRISPTILASALLLIAPSEAGFWSTSKASHPDSQVSTPSGLYHPSEWSSFAGNSMPAILETEEPEHEVIGALDDDMESMIASDLPTPYPWRHNMHNYYIEQKSPSPSSPVAASASTVQKSKDDDFSWEEFNRAFGKCIGIIFGVLTAVVAITYVTVTFISRRQKRKRKISSSRREPNTTGWFDCFGKTINNNGEPLNSREHLVKSLRRYERFYKPRTSVPLTQLDPSTGRPIQNSSTDLRSPPPAYHPSTPLSHIRQHVSRHDVEDGNPFNDQAPETHKEDLESGTNSEIEWHEVDSELDSAVEPTGYSPLGHFSENGGYSYDGATTHLQRFD